MASNAEAWLDTLIEHSKNGQAERAAQALEEASQIDDQEPTTAENDEANPGDNDLTGAPAVQNMFCITYHSP